MKRQRSFKLALLAASALVAGHAGGVLASDAEAASPAPVVAISLAATDGASDKAVVHEPGVPLRNVGIAAILAAGLAALFNVIGWRRLKRLYSVMVGAATQTAKAAATASVSAVKTVGRAVASPLRFGLLAIGLALFAMTGISLLDIEWAAGLATGMVLVALLWFGARRTRRVVSRLNAKNEHRNAARGL